MLRLPGATMFLSANKAHLHSKGLSNVRRCELGFAVFSMSAGLSPRRDPDACVCAGRVQYSICIMNWIWRAFSVSTGWL